MKTSTFLSIMILALVTCLTAQDLYAQNNQGGGGGNGGFGGGGGGNQGNGGGGGGNGGFNRRQQAQQGGGGGGGGGQGFGGNGGNGGNGGGFNRNGGGGQGGGQGFGGGGGQGFGGGGGGRRGRGQRNFNDPNAGQFAPTSQPDDIAIPTPQPMAGTYLMLTSRSIFYRGRFIPADSLQQGPPPTPRDALLIFDGSYIGDNGAELEAFLENQDDGSTTKIHVGDTIAQGKITKITLDSIDFVVNSRTMHLNIGQNLNGDQVYGPTTQPVIDDATASDIIKKLRAKRQAELNGSMH